MSDWDADLDELRWHWDSAYLICCFGLGRWVAQRGDSHATIGAEGPDELRDLIAPITGSTRCPAIRDPAGSGPRASGGARRPGNPAARNRR